MVPHTFTQIEGVFRVEVPMVLLGYSREMGQELEMTTHTHLQLFITLEPPLSLLPPLKDKVTHCARLYVTFWQNLVDLIEEYACSLGR